ncbi:SRPBCC family protein [Mycetocola zhadangensis]|uniref:SRPBCC domain-containing protein n=1 Tax=Mycetocola zhadangensis TaxID=1164595 RepID=A0A3L7J6Q4_9MICO|nr:SRPBCC domain-containing protein [Mycetocola zhadangensis]RLQ86343.1 SRPBCC domain-containing protein [Mycetocola zhadangensis]GGE90367.1 activator of HSP90 ATPase [Mycetocola zhadangensis]
MTLTLSHKDVENLTLTFTTEFAASVDRVWQVWEDPRQLERWWGPPTVPATFTKLEFSPEGDARYFMTMPDGSRAYGWWRILAVHAPHRLEFEDGFSDDSGEPVDSTDFATCAVTLETVENGTRMTLVNTFKSAEQLDEMMKMGMEEGMAEALGQIDAILAESSVSR